MSRFNAVKKEVESILPNSPLNFELAHSKLVLKWVLKLYPKADEALKIAAISHDIERAITRITEKDLVDFSKIDEFKRKHSIRSAKFVGDILNKYKYPLGLISKVKHLVASHEFGGDPDSEILKEADSLAYFDYNIPFYLERNGKERTKEKIKFMYDRLSDKAKKMIRKIKYEDLRVDNLVKEVID